METQTECSHFCFSSTCVTIEIVSIVAVRNIDPSLRLLVPSSPQVWRQSVEVSHHQSYSGVQLNSVDVVDPVDDLVWAFPRRL
jgi:hypothetical protein